MARTSALHTISQRISRNLADVSTDQLVLVACSGGPDSLALAAAAARLERRLGVVIVDHQLQPDSEAVAANAAKQCRAFGLSEVIVVKATVDRGKGNGGLENAARIARREVIEQVAADKGAVAVLLGHTLDDQAETVLLGLARGSGTTSLRGMKPVNGLWRRPMLDLRRTVVADACAEAHLRAHHDPHNEDPSFSRVRVRSSSLPTLESDLGPGVAQALARTAELCDDDSVALEGWATEAMTDIACDDGATLVVDKRLEDLPRAVRTRIYRQACARNGVSMGSLTRDHVVAIDRLVEHWAGQGPIRLPGDVEVARQKGKLMFQSVPPLS